MPPKVKSISQLRKELAAKQGQLKKARAKRAKLVSQLGALDREIANLSGKATPAKRKKAKKTRKIKKTKKVKKAKKKVKVKKARKVAGKKVVKRSKAATRGTRRKKRAMGKPLLEYLKQALARAKSNIRVKELAEAVVKAGYPTKSKDFYGIVAATLRDKKNFQRISRGVYKLKG